MQRKFPIDPDTQPYGGAFYRTREGRTKSRPLTHAKSMHLVLRSPIAQRAWRLTTPRNRQVVREIIHRCTRRYGVRLHSFAINVNHLHFHIHLKRTRDYLGFIRSLTAAIAMAVTGWGRGTPKPPGSPRFWEGRPFTSIVTTSKYFRRLQDYIEINQLEGCGHSRASARFTKAWRDSAPWLLARRQPCGQDPNPS